MLRLAAARCPVVAPSPAGAAAPLAAVLRLATATTQRELSTNTSPPTLCNADTAARGEAQGQQAELPAITPVSLRGKGHLPAASLSFSYRSNCAAVTSIICVGS